MNDGGSKIIINNNNWFRFSGESLLTQQKSEIVFEN
jgi:hypothetical protein